MPLDNNYGFVQKSFKRSALSVAVCSALYCGAHVSAQEQEVDAEGAPLEEVVVTGIRGSLIRAQEIKSGSSSIVEALSAEDIGKLPDSSIAESLARLPGLAGERRNGRTSGLSVRGFKEDFVGTTLNGRELLGIGDNRGVEFDLYPSEILTGAVIYKTPDASLAAVGVGGTVDLRTARPLDVDPTLSVNASLETNRLKSPNPDFDDDGHRYAINFVDKFADDTIGIALAVASTESPLHREQFETWGYEPNGPNGELVPTGANTFAISQVLERDTFSGVFQYRPNHKLDLTVDALYIDFANSGITRGFIEQLPFGTLTSADGDFGRSGTTSGFDPVIRTDPLTNTGELKTFGFNLDYEFNDRWSMKLDVAHSEADKVDQRAESYAGTGRSGLAEANQTTRDFLVTENGVEFSGSSTDFSDFDLVRLAGPQAWGGGLVAFQDQFTGHGVDGVNYFNAQDGFINEATFEEELDSVRLEATRFFEDGLITAVNFGVQYSDRSKSKVNFGAFLTAPTFPFDAPIPEEFREGLTDLSFAGLGSVVAYDALGLIESGFYDTISADLLEASRVADTYTIEEEITTGFVKLDFDTQLFGINVFGNVGVQAIFTDQNATGFSGVRDESGLIQLSPANGGASYSNVLPSLNMNFEITPSHIVRAAVSKVITRPRFDDLRPGGAIGFRFNLNEVSQSTPENGPWFSNSGNPELRPLEADQFDLTYDWYFAADGYLSAGFFYKDLVNWHRNGTEIVDFTPFFLPDVHFVVDPATGEEVGPATFEGVNTFREDGLTGQVDGIELVANVPLYTFSEALDGFGIVFSSAFSNGELDDGSAVPGLSEKVYQLTAYYERNGFEFRIAGTKRSEFESEQRGGSNSLEVVDRQPVELWDAQVSYDFSESSISSLHGLRVSLQAQNLTEEDDVNADEADARQVFRAQRFGTNYILNFNYSF